MKVDVIVNDGLATAGPSAASAEQDGYDGALFPEVAHDPFLPAAFGAAATERIDLFTGIAVAFARNPMTVAVTTSDLHRLSEGRFVLGLGSQIKAHVTRRFSMPWSQPAARMREFIAALRAIWAAWDEGTPLRFEGEFYRHTLMTPMFDHGPNPFGTPRVFLAGVGPAMTRVAGEVADGFFSHGFTTPDYFRDVTVPNLEAGLSAAGRTRAEIEVSLPLMAVVKGPDLDARIAGARTTLSFYGSTPAYRGVLEHHGWEGIGEELTRRSKEGDWARMGDAVTDDMLETFTIIAEEDELAGEVRRRYGGMVDRLQTALDPGIVRG